MYQPSKTTFNEADRGKDWFCFKLVENLKFGRRLTDVSTPRTISAFGLGSSRSTDGPGMLALVDCRDRQRALSSASKRKNLLRETSRPPILEQRRLLSRGRAIRIAHLPRAGAPHCISPGAMFAPVGHLQLTDKLNNWMWARPTSLAARLASFCAFFLSGMRVAQSDSAPSVSAIAGSKQTTSYS